MAAIILQVDSKTKKENHRIQRHDSYNTVIPKKIAEELNLQDYMILHATASQKTGTIRLHTGKLQDSIRVQVRKRLTKIYKGEKHYSTKVTIPIEFARLLDLKKYDKLDIDSNKNTVIIKKIKSRNSSVLKNPHFFCNRPINLTLLLFFLYFLFFCYRTTTLQVVII